MLNDKHLGELRASEISDDLIQRSNIHTAKDHELRDILGNPPKEMRGWGEGFVIPYRRFGSTEPNYFQVKLDFPRTNGEGRSVKYENPRGQDIRAYFAPGFEDSLRTGAEIVITEGAKKSLACQSAGIPCVGVNGVWGWQQKRQRSDTGRAFGQRRLIPDLEAIAWKGRNVVICFDSDVVSKPLVQLAEARLSEILTKAGATVTVARLPADGDGKMGLDDYLVKHGVDAFKRILEAAEPADVPEATLMDLGRMFIDERHTCKTGLTLRWYRDEYYAWHDGRHVQVPNGDLAADVLLWLDRVGMNATPRCAADIVKCLGAVVRVPFDRPMPIFLDHAHQDIDPRNIVAFENGLLDITGTDLKVYPLTPSWFSTVRLPYPFDPQAEFPYWEAFLRETLVDEDKIDLLQRWFGLMLTPDTSFQKLLLMIGPKRSGKGTVLRTLQAVIGHNACVAPTLASLSSEFGLWQLVGKTVALFPDAHLSARSDSVRILEAIKSIVGEDSISVNRKNLPYLPNCRLNVRFILSVNELPRFSDASNALGARLLILPFEKSFAGSEDRTLEKRLVAEASGIFNWALRGLHRLRQAGGFNTPEASKAIIENFQRATSPVSAFLEDLCEVSAEHEVSVDDAYFAWCQWADDNGHKPGAKSTFGIHLAASESGIKKKRGGSREARAYIYRGFRLTNDGENAAAQWQLRKAQRERKDGSVS